MDTELTDFLQRNRACAGGIRRLENHGVETLADAWKKAAPADLVWAVTRPGVMSPEQRRQFLVFVLESIEGKLSDARSTNILEKLRTKSPITEADAYAAWAAAARADAYASAEVDAASWVVASAASWVADANEYASARADAAAARAAEASEADAYAAARKNQARWIRTNFKLADLRTN